MTILCVSHLIRIQNKGLFYSSSNITNVKLIIIIIFKKNNYSDLVIVLFCVKALSIYLRVIAGFTCG